MKKILFIIPTLTQTNGVAAFMVNYLKHFHNVNFKIELVYQDLRPSKTYLDFFKEKGIKIFKLPYVRDVGLKEYCRSIANFFENHHDYDLIYSNVGYQTVFFYTESKKYKLTKYAIHAHGTQASDNKWKNIIGNLLQKRVNRFSKYKFACSELAGKAMFKNFNFEVINNAIDYNKYKFNEEARKSIRKELNISDNTKVLGFVGRFVPQKNVFFFIDLLCKISNDYFLLMIGNGPLKEKFFNRIKELNLENKVIFFDETSHIYDYYSAFDFLLLPSLYEGLPVVGVEAQANGLPCLFSNTISRECKISNNTIYLDYRDILSWIDNIMKMSRDINLQLNDDFNIIVQAVKFEKRLFDILEDN